MQPERKLVQKIQRYLDGEGARCFKIHGGDNPFQEAGIPDLLCCWRGLFIALEVKLPGEKPSPKQASILRQIERSGGVARVVTSVMEVERLLRSLRRER